MSATSAGQLSSLIAALVCALASVWFLLVAAPGGGRSLAWGALALGFCLVCVAAAFYLRRLLWEAFMSPGHVSYSLALLVSGLWAFVSAVLMGACERGGAGKAAQGWAVSFVALSVVSAYCFWRVL